MKTENKRIKLDWEKLLGFNQVKTDNAERVESEPNTKSLQKIGARVGGKGGGGGEG